MQYLLTDKELEQFQNEERNRIKKHIKVLQDLCTQVCDLKPIDWGWGEPEDPKPWGCILTRKEEWYCDQCPVQDVCPHPAKHWSK